tara:strand:- start:4543 stop:4959 length:417 start_codon:yes stop_codon:yes gene_type:complete
MSALSDHAENSLLDHVLGTSAFTKPAKVYVGLHTQSPNESASAATEVGGSAGDSTTGGYSRIEATFGAAANGSASNNANITFNTATSDYGTISHIGIYDSSTPGAGNLLLHGALDASKIISTGDTLQISTGSLTITLA